MTWAFKYLKIHTLNTRMGQERVNREDGLESLTPKLLRFTYILFAQKTSIIKQHLQKI